MPAAFFDFFRKVVLKSTDGVTVETEIEADSFTDELNIIRGNGVAFNGDNATDTFSIDVDYTLDIPLGTTDLVLTDVNSGTSTVQLIEGNNIQLTRISASELRIDGADLTVSITNINLINPIRITSGSVHGLANGASITIQDVAGTIELNGNSYFVSVISSTEFDLYTDSARTIAVDGTTGFTAYASGGSIQIENTATLEAFLDVEITSLLTDQVLNYNGTDWVNTASLTLTNVDADIDTDSITAKTNLDINSAAGQAVSITNGSDFIRLQHDTGNVTVDTAGAVSVNGATITIGDGTNAIDIPDGTSVDLTGVTVTGAAFDLTGDVTGNVEGDVTGDIYASNGTSKILENGTDGTDATFTGNAATATALADPRTITINSGFMTAPAVAFDGTADIILAPEIDNNAVLLGTKTSGNYVATVTGTANQIDLVNSVDPADPITGETIDLTLSLSPTLVVPGSLTVTTDLIVNGTTTTVNTTDLVVTDNTIMLNKDEAGAGVTAGSSGIEIERGSANNARWVWDEPNDTWTSELWNGVTWAATSITASEFIGPLTGQITGNLIGNVLSEDGLVTVLENGTDGSNATFTGDVTGDVTGNADTATALNSAIEVSLFGEVTGATTTDVDGSGNIIIANTAITGFDERVQDAAALLFSNATHTGVTTTYDDGASSITIDVNDPVITIDGAVDGSATMTDLGDVTITVTPANDSITLGTHTSGNYVESLVAGTGITLTNNTGETATPTITAENIPNASLDNSVITITDSQGTPNTQDVALGDTITFVPAAPIEIAVSATNSVNVGHGTSGVVDDTYGGAAAIPSFVVDEYGHITSAIDNVLPSPTITLLASANGGVNGAVTLSELADGNITTTLAAALTNITDIDYTAGVNGVLNDGDVLIYDSVQTKWKPFALPGGASAPTLQAVTASGATTSLSIETGGLTTPSITADGPTLTISGGTVTFDGSIDATAASTSISATEFSGPIKGNVTSTDGNDTLLVDAANAQIDYANVINGPSIPERTEFYLQSTAPAGAAPGSDYIGTGNSFDLNLGLWTEVTFANRVANGFGPGSATYDPTLTGITYSQSGFRGFEQGSTYEIDVTLIPSYSSITIASVDQYIMSAKDVSTVLTKDVSTGYVEPSIDQGTSIKLHMVATFENSNASSNIVEILSDRSQQDPNYFIAQAYCKIRKIV
jgi:hypothetical protein